MPLYFAGKRALQTGLQLFLLLVCLVGCKEDGITVAAPNIYLLNSTNHWTPDLVINFSEAVAPITDNGQNLSSDLPKLSPAVAGSWRWQDPSRLVFLPERDTFIPDTQLHVDLQDVKLRQNYHLAQRSFDYRTPTLTASPQVCAWQDSVDAPLRRSLQFTVVLNYPLYAPQFKASLSNGSSVDIGSVSGSLLQVATTQLVRPAADDKITAVLPAGKFKLLIKDEQGRLQPGVDVSLPQTINCELAIKREDWDKFDHVIPAEPTLTDISSVWQDNRLSVSLQGEALTESVTKEHAGQAVTAGIALKPEAAGHWIYNDVANVTDSSCDEAGECSQTNPTGDLIFIPDNPAALKPGTHYEITLTQAAFPKIKFSKDAYQTAVTIPAMDVAISNFSLYSDPVDVHIKRATATLTFTYPPQRDSVSANVNVWLTRMPKQNATADKATPYELSYDEKNLHVAYLKTVPVQIADDPAELNLQVTHGITATAGGEPIANNRDANLIIPSARDYLQVASVELNSVIKEDESLQRLVVLKSNVALKDPATLAQFVEVYLLPDCQEQSPARLPICQSKEVTMWESSDQIDVDVIKAAQLLPVTWQDAQLEDHTVQYLSFTAPENRQLFVKVKKGLESLDGFKLYKDARYLLEIGANQRELKILHDGALLSLSGSKKLGVTARGINQVHVELQRILPHNMHHVISFSDGKFQNPTFNLPIEHFAEKLAYDEALPVTTEMSRQYFAVDFGRFIRDKGFPPRGLFVLSVSEKQPENCQPPAEEAAADTETATDEAAAPDATDSSAENSEDTSAASDNVDGCETQVTPDKRLVLLTDMGLLVKTAANGSQDLFVMSFRTGTPVAGAQVSLLGKNGVALFSGKTSNDGHFNMPSTEGLTAEKTPVVYLAEKDGDLSFIPFNRDNRKLDFSRFDTDGVRDQADTLQAFLFSDRGIYRPGDTVHAGVILRKRDWSALPVGLPLKAVISDPENQQVWSQTVSFGTEGFAELNWQSPAAGKTGTYRLELLLADKSKKSLGMTRIRVEEFQPDRLQVNTDLPQLPASGWLSPEQATARVKVRNLFGTAAAGNVAKLEMTAHPWAGQVKAFSDYRFRPSAADKIPDLPQALGEQTTDANGEAKFKLPLAAITEPVYEITLAGEGFEKGAGRSVVSVATALVSRQPYLLGYKADGALDFIPKDTNRQLNLLALGADFQPHGNDKLSVELYENRYVSTLVQRQDGLYEYQSVQRQQLQSSKPLTLTNGKADYALATHNPGQYYALFKNAQGEEVNRVDYTVAGDGNVTRNIDRNAELTLNLNKKEYQPGETIELEIIAPYQGAGLITIEQDGVLVKQWFKSATTASTQKVTLPNTISGNAYLTVAFVRAMDAKEIYMSPLSFGVTPFSISKQRFTQDISLQVPEKVQPGKTLSVQYQLKEPGKLLIYAVDEGILQFAHYSNPQPLDYFFRKRALQVKTYQILDMILPDYALMQRLAAPGGDEDKILGKYKNPFARKHKAPMAYWSGIIDAQAGTHTLDIPVPDYFNGSIRVLAVAVNAGKLAVPVSKTVASQPYVLQPQQPWVVAPGDEFDMGLLVANASGEPGQQTLQVQMSAGQALEVQGGDKPQTLTLGPGQDATVRFHVKAKEQLGPLAVHYQVNGANQQAEYTEELSIRPAQPLLTTLQGGVLTITEQQKGKTQTLNLQRQLFAEQQQNQFSLSITPAAYLRGIVEYLRSYPYGCTEQITSQAFPAAILGANPELGLSANDAERMVARSIHTLQTRQKFDGSFGYWTVGDQGNPYYSMYATHLLLEVKEHGLKLPETMLERALGYANEYTQTPRYDLLSLDTQAYGFYLLARNGQQLAERLRAFEASMQNPQTAKVWMSNKVRFYLAAAYKLHHLDQDAARLLTDIQRQWQAGGQLPKELQGNPEDLSLYLYLAGKHMPEILHAQDSKFGQYLLELSQDLLKQRLNSFRGSLALLGMSQLWQYFGQDQQNSYTVLAGTPLAQLGLQGNTIKTAALTATQQPLEIKGTGKWNLYYQLSETGYDRSAPKAVIVQKLLINRELLNDQGEAVTQIGLQDKLHIRLGFHPDQAMQDVAVQVLIPGGFEIDLSEQGLAARKSLPIAKKPLWEPDYIDVQEDRIVLFGGFDGKEKYFEFQLKPLNSGNYQVPPVFAEGMYNTEIQYRGLAEQIMVKE